VNPETFSDQVEALLVERNPRNMASLRAALDPGYCLRAARLLEGRRRVLIGTGFPVAGSFETDGPLGAIALYRALESLGAECALATAEPLAQVLEEDFRIVELTAYEAQPAREEVQRQLEEFKPDLIISIERPGLHGDGRYYNMRGADISERCAIFDYHVELADCPCIGIGDGGNEIGMGKVAEAVSKLAIRGARTGCDELIVADVSNWGAYGLLALLEIVTERPMLRHIDHRELLVYLSERGSVDGVTGENTLSEDSLPLEAGETLLERLRGMCRSFGNI